MTPACHPPRLCRRCCLHLNTCKQLNKQGLKLDLQTRPSPKALPTSLPRQTELQELLHKPHRHQRKAIILALHDTNDLDLRRTAERLAGCSSTVLITHSMAAGTTRPWMPRCNSRLCPFCGQSKARKVADKLHALITRMDAPRHVTLTYRSNTNPLRLQLKQLRAAAANMRRSPLWKKHVLGGSYSIEVTRNAETGLWHPHLHLIIDGTYMPQKLLARLWADVMPGGEHVWITKVDDARNAAWEVAKYIGKPPLVKGWPAAAIREFAQATHGTRMIQTFGLFFNEKLDADEEEPLTHPDDRFVSLPRIAWLAKFGHDLAADAVTLFWLRFPMVRAYLMKQVPAACGLNSLRTEPGLKLPMPPLLPRGRLGPITDEASRDIIDAYLDVIMRQLFELQDRGSLQVEHDMPGLP